MPKDFGYNVRSEVIGALMGTNTYNYAYDPIGNRVSDTSNALTHVYEANALNQYEQITNGNIRSLTYDWDGNLTNDSVFAYVWDGENRLVGVNGSGVAIAHSYDYMSRRAEKTVNGVTNRFTYDGWNLVAETSTAGVTNFYVWGADLSGSLQGAGGIGGLLAVIRNGKTYYPVADANGNITDYVDANGSRVAHREFDAYGNTLVATGPMVNDFSFWFSSKYLDHETGLYYYGYRYYSPDLGRWLNRDPIRERGGLNLYIFVENNPLNSVDTLGEMSSQEVWNIVKSAVGSLGNLLWGFSDDAAKQQNALGVNLGISSVATTGWKIGINGMFFPETCELAVYWYASGSLRPDRLQEDKNAVIQLLHAMPVGLNIGGSGEFVKADRIGGGVHGAESWLEWFYQGSGQIGSGLPVGIAGSIFASDKWAGVSVGLGVGPGVPVGAIGPVPITASGDIAALYFDRLPASGWLTGKTYLNIHDHKCACAALRALSLESNDVLATILKKLFQ